MKLKLKKILLPILVSFFILLLNGCANSKQKLIIAPQVTEKFSNLYAQISVNLKTSDTRASAHIVQILRKDKAAELINSAIPISIIVEKSISNIFKQQGLKITNTNIGNKINITIFIDTALISVEQDLMKYQVNNTISLRLQTVKANNTLTKNFNSHGKSNGPLNADLAVLERDFNQQLAKLIQQIAADTEIQTFIAQ